MVWKSGIGISLPPDVVGLNSRNLTCSAFVPKLWHHPPIPQDLGNTPPPFKDEEVSSPAAPASAGVKGPRRPLSPLRTRPAARRPEGMSRGGRSAGTRWEARLGARTRNPSGRWVRYRAPFRRMRQPNRWLIYVHDGHRRSDCQVGMRWGDCPPGGGRI